MVEPKRPKNVPKESQWNNKENEWELGKKNKNGKHIGELKWWLAPNGYLCCHSFYDDDGKIVSAKRYHPNGELAWEFLRGKNEDEVSIYYRSSEETDEYFPKSPFKNSWKASKIGGYF